MQKISFTCCALTSVLMVFACSTSQWVVTDGWSEGLFQQCVHQEDSKVPFGQRLQLGCHRAHDAGKLAHQILCSYIECPKFIYNISPANQALGLNQTQFWNPETVYISDLLSFFLYISIIYIHFTQDMFATLPHWLSWSVSLTFSARYSRQWELGTQTQKKSSNTTGWQVRLWPLQVGFKMYQCYTYKEF